MTIRLKILLMAVAAALLLLNSCDDREDPGHLQEYEREYALIDFTRLEMGSAFDINVKQGSTYRINVRGDRRNIDDLDVFKQGNTLIIKFDNNANRKHRTYITITMPTLEGVSFSGASISAIEGFESEGNLDLVLSGASVSQLDAGYGAVDVVLSGSSTLRMYGLGDRLDANLSGASSLSAFEFPIREAELNVSGASHAKVTTSDQLNVIATGASSVLYRGTPTVEKEVSGASSVEKD